MSSKNQITNQSFFRKMNVVRNTLIKWTCSTNHKLIGNLYFGFGLLAGVIGTLLTVFTRWELGKMGPEYLTTNNNQLYVTFTTSHAIVMIFFMAIPILIWGAGNWLIPVLVRVPGMALPWLNKINFWLLPISLVLFLVSTYVETTKKETGWILDPSLLPNITGFSLTVDLATSSMVLWGLNSIVNAIIFTRTLRSKEASGLLTGKQFSFVLFMLVTAFLIGLVALLVLSCSYRVIVSDNNFVANFLKWEKNSRPTVFLSFFWFFGQMEFFVLILPGMGFISNIIFDSAKKPETLGCIGMMFLIGLFCKIGIYFSGVYYFAPIANFAITFSSVVSAFYYARLMKIIHFESSIDR